MMDSNTMLEASETSSIIALLLHQPTLLHSNADINTVKITEKVSFNIASEVSYVYVLSGQKFIKKKSKMVKFDEFLKT